jgi:hypothetical protein
VPDGEDIVGALNRINARDRIRIDLDNFPGLLRPVKYALFTTRNAAARKGRGGMVARDLDGSRDIAILLVCDIAKRLVRDIDRARDIARATTLDSTLLTVGDRARTIVRDLDPDPDTIYVPGCGDLSHDLDLAREIARELDAQQVDASGTDLSGMKIRYLAALNGITWTRRTTWPSDIAGQVEEHSQVIRPGVYQVHLGDAREPSRPHSLV